MVMIGHNLFMEYYSLIQMLNLIPKKYIRWVLSNDIEFETKVPII